VRLDPCDACIRRGCSTLLPEAFRMPDHPDDSHAAAPAPGDRPDHTVDVRDASASKADPFAGAPGASSASLEKPGDQIGPYKLISMLGEGGFGEVWLAERKQPFTQQVALKVIKAGMDSKAVIGRFEQERQALAVMNHPHVAKVLDGGLTPQGRPYFAMEYVKGEPITDFCDRQKLSIKDRLRLFMQVCEAIQHAHTKGIIHRDLKPGNVLVGLASDDTPQAKVIDFGVAKALTQRMTEKTVFTETGQMIGTPLYMSPEQADPTDQDIDTRSDVYSLGVILYELLAGATPFDLQDLRSRAYREVQRMIREQDPPTPSARLSTIATKDTALASKIAEARKDAAATLTRTLRSELEWIPLKAMRKERKERYDTPADLARDVQNYLEGRPLVAAPESTAYRVRKYIRRHRGFVIGSSTVLAALVLGLGLATWQWWEARTARDAAISARDAANTSEAKAIAARDRSENLIAVISIRAAFNSMRRNDVSAATRELDIAKFLGRDGQFPFQVAHATMDASIQEPMRGHTAMINGVAFSPDGKTLASASGFYSDSSDDRTIRLWDIVTGSQILEIHGHECGVTDVKFSPNGRTLASASCDKTVRIWDASTGRAIGEPLRGHGDEVTSIAFSPDGRTLASASKDSTVRLWDPAAGTCTRVPNGHTGWVTGVAFSPDGRTLASAGSSGDYSVRLWDIESSRTTVLQRGEREFNAISFSPDGKTVASASGAAIWRWDTEQCKQIGDPLRGHADYVNSINFSPTGKILASGGDDKTIRLWDASTGEQIGEPRRGHDSDVTSVTFGPDGQTLASASNDQTIRLWDTSLSEIPGRLSPGLDGKYVNCVALSPDGTRLASGHHDGNVRLWDVATGRPLGVPLNGHQKGVRQLSFSADGNTLATASTDKTLRLWDAWTGKPMGEPLRGHEDWVISVDFSPDGRMLASASADKTVRLWDAAAGKPLCEPLRGHEGYVTSVAFSPNGKMLASASDDKTVRLWDAATGKPLREPLRGHEGRVASVAFSPDGRTIASSSWDKTIRLWDAVNGKPLGEPLWEHGGRAFEIAFCPDGRTLASSGKDSIHLWDIAAGMIVAELPCSREGNDNSITFASNGKTLASSAPGVAVLWHALPMRERIRTIRTTTKQIHEVRNVLADRIAAIGESETATAELQHAVLADPRFSGELRRAALIVVGEIELGRKAKQAEMARARTARLEPLRKAYAAKDWPRTLDSLKSLSDADTATFSTNFWNTVAWQGLTEVPTDSPSRDIGLLLLCAERAVELSERKDGAVLDTLARAHWELGDKPKAIEVQLEAVAATEASLSTMKDEETAAQRRKALDEMKSTLAAYERDQPPAPPAAAPASTKPSP
jgi:WD40 repeat protein/serine/threonine protein kinase